jgi:microcystin-dependent protein
MRAWNAVLVAGLVATALGVFAVSCDYDDLDGVPAGFADGVDNEGNVTPGAGLTENGGLLEADFEGTGADLGTADTVARSDHTHSYADDFVNVTGDNMTGDLSMGGTRKVDLAAPTSAGDAATKSYVDTMTVSAVPQGAIIMWSGALAAIPPGWQLCNGTNGTPDLRDRFIRGTSDAEKPGAMGGADNVSLTEAQMPGHTHGFATGNTSVDHTHTYSDTRLSHVWYEFCQPVIGAVECVSDLAQLPNLENTSLTDMSTSHNHVGTTDSTGSGEGFDNRPAYYKLAFIMKL